MSTESARKAAIIDALRAFVRSKPGLEFGNYGDVTTYRSEMRRITNDRHHAERLLAAVEWREGITADNLIEAAKHGFSGRLTIRDISAHYDDGSTMWIFKIDYCTGQYYPTEYRRAVCAVLSAALWEYWRDADARPTGAAPSLRPRMPIRALALQEFGRPIASRYFN